MTAKQHNHEVTPTPHKTHQPPRPQAESGGLDYKSVVEFINEEAGPVGEKWPSAEAIADHKGEDTLMDETSLKFPFSPRGPCVSPPHPHQPTSAGQPASPFTLIPQLHLKMRCATAHSRQTDHAGIKMSNRQSQCRSKP